MSCALISWILAATVVAKAANAAVIPESPCPMDCICYPDYLSNLASWKWIETKGDLHTGHNDPDHEEFNPYTEHNEVYDNPASLIHKKEDPLKTVTCILRNGSTDALTNLFSGINSDTQILSLLQAVGSGSVTLEEKYFGNLRSIIGIQLQGYKTTKGRLTQSSSDVFKVAPDAFTYLDKLIYLSLENVVIQERELENRISATEYFVATIIKFTRSGSITHIVSNGTDGNGRHQKNNLESQLIFMDPDDSNDDSAILPYNTYKMKREMESIEEKRHPKPLEPKLRVAFTDIPTLLQLRISECNLDGITWDMFYKLNNLMYLILERNDLLFLPDFVFYATPNLTALSLADNRILNLQTVGLAGLLQLRKLDVTSNNLTYLSELSLPPFPHLEIADFRLNPIETVFPNTFEVMNSTKTLYLGSATIPLEFHTNSFFGLMALTKLELNNVRIEFLERPMLQGMPELRSLTMNGKVTRISFDAFSEVPNLEKLILKKCSIKKISMDAFYGLSSLLELDLSHNLLTNLPPGLLDDQVQLEELYLQHNKLVTLPHNLFFQSPLKIIRLDNNQWHCSCDMITWNPKIVNQVKRYGIVKNQTICQRQYDKGSMCGPQHVKFQARYVYERKVSPICSTPSKFSQRGVFEVIRKEFKFCTVSTTKTVSASTEAQILEPILLNANTTPKFTIIKTKEQLDKQKEKDAYFANLKPAKVKKPQLTFPSVVGVLENSTVSLSSQSQRLREENSQGDDRNPTLSTSVPVMETITYSHEPTPEPTTELVVTPQSTQAPSLETTKNSTTSIPNPTAESILQLQPSQTFQQSAAEHLMNTEPTTTLPTSSLTSALPTTSLKRDESGEDSVEAIRFNRIDLFQFKSSFAEDTVNTNTKIGRWPFQSKVKTAPKQLRQHKFGPSNSSPVLSKNALKLARIQRRLEKRL